MLFFKKLIKIKKSGLTYLSGLLISLFLIQPVVAQETIWLSNTPPKSMEKQVKTNGMHRLSILETEKRSARPKSGGKKVKSEYGKATKDSTNKRSTKSEDKKNKRSYGPPPKKYIQWLRKGSSITDAEYICLNDSTNYQLTLMSPEGKKEGIELVKNKTCYAKFELNEEGYYNAYLIIKKDLGDTLHINIAKAELLNHSCRNGHHKKLEARPVNYYPEITDFEIIRERNPHEDYHYFTSSGNMETYKAIFEGKPLAGVKVKINTEKGWSKTQYTNENGELSTEYIQDYFSNWQELNTREIYYYMLEADYTVKKDINYKGKDYGYIQYSLTMSDGYRPARTMYSSMVWGLVVFLITMIVSIAGIFIYKERRKRPYKEIKFNESDK